MQLQISGGPGHFAIELSSDRSVWNSTTNFITPVFTWRALETNQPARFYRVLTLP